MATLADQRRAIGERNVKARRGLGEENAKARRALGDEMIKRRTGRDDVDDINAVVRQPRQRAALPAVAPRGGVPAQVGTGTYSPPPATAGGGLASPVNEPSFAAREYWANGLLSSDGLFVIPAVKKIVMQDANGAPAVFEYAQPVVPSP